MLQKYTLNNIMSLSSGNRLETPASNVEKLRNSNSIKSSPRQIFPAHRWRKLDFGSASNWILKSPQARLWLFSTSIVEQTFEGFYFVHDFVKWKWDNSREQFKQEFNQRNQEFLCCKVPLSSSDHVDSYCIHVIYILTSCFRTTCFSSPLQSSSLIHECDKLQNQIHPRECKFVCANLQRWIVDQVNTRFHLYISYVERDFASCCCRS